MIPGDRGASSGSGVSSPTDWGRLLRSHYTLTRLALVAAVLLLVHLVGFSAWFAAGIVWAVLPYRLIVIAAAERFRAGRWQWVAWLVALAQLLGLLIWVIIGLLGGFLPGPL